MKGVALLLAVSAVNGYLIPPKSSRIDWRYEQKRQIVGTITSLLGKGGKVMDPWGAAPRRAVLRTDSQIPGVKRVKIRSGPYSVPNVNRTSLIGESGMLWNYPDKAIDKPCSTCVIVGQWAGLEFPDGRNANIDNGMWLHHMVAINIGSGRYDPTCYGMPSLPHIDVDTSPGSSERYFSSGNERTQVHLDVLGNGKTKWGYQLNSGDKIGWIVDLMNINGEDKTVYLTMYYDFLEGTLPSGWRNVRVVWLDANQCGTSEVWPPQENGEFNTNTRYWTASFSGDILGVGGHLHDGGDYIDIYANNQLVCHTQAGYGETPEYVNKGRGGHAGGGHDHGAGMHISSMSQCYLEAVPKSNNRGIVAAEKLGVLKLSKGQSWYGKGHYNYKKYGGMKNSNGKQDEIMVISLAFIAADS